MAKLSAFQTVIEALTVTLFTPRTTTVASPRGLWGSRRPPLAMKRLGLLRRKTFRLSLDVLWLIAAWDTATLGTTILPPSQALAIHLETSTLWAPAPLHSPIFRSSPGLDVDFVTAVIGKQFKEIRVFLVLTIYLFEFLRRTNDI